MTTRTYTRTYQAEVTQTFAFTDADLTPEEIAALNAWEAGDDSVSSLEVSDIVGEFGADHEEVSVTDYGDVTIERTR